MKQSERREREEIAALAPGLAREIAGQKGTRAAEATLKLWFSSSGKSYDQATRQELPRHASTLRKARDKLELWGYLEPALGHFYGRGAVTVPPLLALKFRDGRGKQVGKDGPVTLLPPCVPD